MVAMKTVSFLPQTICITRYLLAYVHNMLNTLCIALCARCSMYCMIYVALKLGKTKHCLTKQTDSYIIISLLHTSHSALGIKIAIIS